MRHVNRALTALILGFALLVFGRAFGVTIFVDDDNANPSPDGTVGNPYPTIQGGIDAAASGDIVQVAPGLYDTTSQRVTSLGSLTAVAFMRDRVDVVASDPDPAQTIIEAGSGSRGVVFDNVQAGLIDGFTIRNGDPTDFQGGGGILSFSSSSTIANSVITGNRSRYRGAGILIEYGGPTLLEDNLITYNIAAGVYSYYFLDGGGAAVSYSDATLRNNTFIGNQASRGGALSAFQSDLTLDGDVITGNQASAGGGAYLFYTGATLTNTTVDGNGPSGAAYAYTTYRGGGLGLHYSDVVLSGGSVSGNASPLPASGYVRGGGIESIASRLDVSGTNITGNMAQYGGGIHAGFYTATTIANANIEGNVASNSGGGVEQAYYVSSVEITGGTVSFNQANNGPGGGLHLRGGGSLTVDGTQVEGNTAYQGGGGISASGYYGAGSILTVRNSRIAGNSVTGPNVGGGGLSVNYGVVEVTGSTIGGNSSIARGGGIGWFSAQGRIDTTEIAGNTTGDNGGGIYAGAECSTAFDRCGSTLWISNSLIRDNTAYGTFMSGGGVSARIAHLAITNSTIVGNQAPAGPGGGLAANQVLSLYLSNDIFAGNSAYPFPLGGGGGGGVYHNNRSGAPAPIVTNSDWFGNTPEDWVGVGYPPTIPSPVPGNGNIDLDPQFANPGVNDYHLLAGSPAIDAGDPAAVGLAGPDLDGNPRVSDGDAQPGAVVDMGAYELPSGAPNAAPLANATARPGFRHGDPFPLLVLDATRSFDPDGSLLTFRWSQTGGPPVTIDSPTSPFPSITAIGTPRANVLGPYGYSAAPTPVQFDVTVSDGVDSDTARVEVRMADQSSPVTIDVAGYQFGHELGVLPQSTGIAFTPTGSEVVVVGQGAFGDSARAPVIRDPSSGRIRGIGQFRTEDTSRFAQHIAIHPNGTMFLSNGSAIIEQRTPLGVVSSLDLLATLGLTGAYGMEFVPGELPNAGTLLVAGIDASPVIYFVELLPVGDGTFFLNSGGLWAALSTSGILGPGGLAFRRSGSAVQLLVSDGSQSAIFEVAIDQSTGLALGSPTSPVVTSAWSDLSFRLWPWGLATDPLGDTILAMTPSSGFPRGAIVMFEPLPFDLDADGVADQFPDNCPSVPNPTQADTGGVAGVGDACDNVAPLVADLGIVMSHAGDFTAGSTGSYTITVDNLGTLDEPGPVTVNTTLPAGLTFNSIGGASTWVCNPGFPVLSCIHPGPVPASGGLEDLLLDVDVNPAAVPSVTPVASVTGALGELNAANNTAADPTTVLPGAGPFADLGVTAFDSPDPVAPDGQLTYSVTVSNAGPDPAANVVLSSNISAEIASATTSGCSEDPNGLPTCTLGSIASGGFAPVLVTAIVASTATGTISSTFTTSSDVSDPNPGDNAASPSTTVTAAVLSLAKTHPGDFTAGATGQYTLTVNNGGGGQEAGPITVTDTLPLGMTYASFSSNDLSWSCAGQTGGFVCTYAGSLAPVSSLVPVVVTVNVPTAGNAINTALVTGVTDITSSSASDPTIVLPAATPTADLSIAKVGTPDPVLAGGAFSYTVTVDNLGPDDAPGVVVTDSVPAFLTGLSTSGCAEDNLVGVPTCTLGTIAAQGSASYTISGTLSPAAIGNMSNTASVTSSTNDPNNANNSTTIVTEIDDKAIADAGADTRGTTGSTLVLDGSGSSDPEAVPLTYRWRQVSGATLVPIAAPLNATTAIDVSQVTPTDLLTFALDVDDGASGIVTDFVNVQIVPFPEWHRWRHDSTNSGVTPSQGPAVQSSNLSVTFPGAVRSSVSFDTNDGMYVGNDDGNLYSLNLDGTVRWAFLTGGPVRTTPLVAGSHVYFGSMDGNLYAVEQATGIQSWSFNGGAGSAFRFSSPVLSSGSEIIAGTSDGLVVALDDFSGQERWRFQAGGAVHSSPAIYSGNQTLVLFGSTDGFVRALEVFNSGQLAWETGFGIPVQSGITVDPQTSRAYFGTDAGQVVAVQADTGQVVWTFQASGAVTSSPALDTARGQVIVGSDDFKVYALDAATGALNWEYATSSYVRSSPTVDSVGNVYVGSCDGNMYALDAGSGSELFTFPLSSGVIVASPTVGTDGLVYLGSTNTFLYLIGPDPFAGGQEVMAPRLDSLTPSTLMQGETVEISVRGRDLTQGTGLDLGPGIRVESTELLSPTEMTARVRLAEGAPLGTRDVQTRRETGLPSSRLGGLEVTFDCRRADMTGDGTVDGLDLVALAGRFGSAAEAGTAVDLDGDGRVDGADLALLAAGFGRGGRTCR